MSDKTTVNEMKYEINDMLNRYGISDSFDKCIIKQGEKMGLVQGAKAENFIFNKLDELVKLVDDNRTDKTTDAELKTLISGWIEEQDRIADQMVQVEKEIKILQEENTKKAKTVKKPKDLEIKGKVYHLINFYSPNKEDQEERAKELREKWGVTTKVIKSNDAWALCWHAENKMDEFKASIEILRPHLEQRIWPPLSGMRIPGILNAADKLILEISNYESPENERKEALLIEISNLRKRFRVDNSSGTSCSKQQRPTDRKIKINEML